MFIPTTIQKENKSWGKQDWLIYYWNHREIYDFSQ